MIRTLLSLYSFKLPFYYVYMMQQVEYEPKKFIEWFERLFKKKQRIQSTTYRKSLVYTRKAKLLLIALYLFVAILFGLIAILFRENFILVIINWLVLVIAIPFMLELFIVGVVTLAYEIFVKPAKKKTIKLSQSIFSKIKAKKIAVIGSYGKTTMKELLHTVLSEGLSVASTPGNMNVAISHARFAKKLSGTEDVVIVEFGEGEPGDVLQMSKTIRPDYAVITGLAPNHLDHYSDIASIAKDIFSVYDVVGQETVTVTVTDESTMLQEYIPKNSNRFSRKAVMGWKISSIEVSFSGIEFIMKKSKQTMHIKSGLLGAHQVAPIAYVAALAHELGLTIKQIETGCSKTKAFDHRMQPRNLHGAWIIDDTYNGNLEGLKAGLKLLEELPGSRKWYVTPGLVDQGNETFRVHNELGKYIAEVNPDKVVLIQNSVTQTIIESMNENNFSGELLIEENPLEFYTNIDQILANGDVVLMQNDWTDNYN